MVQTRGVLVCSRWGRSAAVAIRWARRTSVRSSHAALEAHLGLSHYKSGLIVFLLHVSCFLPTHSAEFGRLSTWKSGGVSGARSAVARTESLGLVRARS